MKRAHTFCQFEYRDRRYKKKKKKKKKVHAHRLSTRSRFLMVKASNKAKFGGIYFI